MTIKTTLIALAIAATATMGITATSASAAGYHVNAPAKTANFPGWDRLNIRAWPAAHSAKVAHVKVNRSVYVERCIIKSGSDWCKIKKGWKYGWVNGSYLRKWGQTFRTPHPSGYGWH